MLALLDLYHQFLDAKTNKGLSPRTLESYRSHCGHFVLWMQDQPLTRATLRAYLSHVATDRSAITTAAYLRDVSVFCGWLVDEGEIETNPATRLKPRIPKRQPASYNKAQVRALLAKASERDRALMVTLLDTGLRVGELVTMTRSGVDWKTGHFTVIGKGNKERAGWLSAYALMTIKAYLEIRLDRDPALWIGRLGPLTGMGVHRIIHHCAEVAGIRDDVRRLVHAFRATFAKNYVMRGGDLESLRRLLGHESIAMSAHYAQLADDELAEQKQRINPLAAFIEDAA